MRNWPDCRRLSRILARHESRSTLPVSQFANANARRVLAIMSLALALAALLALTWWVYHPGLSGDFLFDDFANLPAIGATGPVDNWATFWRYITSGNADPSGRPLTLLTFLIDARDWPASPYPFKVTNVILHLINGALLAWVLWKLGWALIARGNIPPPLRGDPLPAEGGGKNSGVAASLSSSVRRAERMRTRATRGEGDGGSGSDAAATTTPSRATHGPGMTMDERGIAIAALFGAGAWLLHPLFVSTTLYIVQREATLPATFVLVGMLGWMASREALARGHVKRALAGMALSAWGCTTLAVLCKANGALFPLLLLLAEWIVLSRAPVPSEYARRWHRRAVAVFLMLPGAM